MFDATLGADDGHGFFLGSVGGADIVVRVDDHLVGRRNVVALLASVVSSDSIWQPSLVGFVLGLHDDGRDIQLR